MTKAKLSVDSPKYSNNRKNIRFSPEPNTLVSIDTSPEGKGFISSITGLAISESYKGAGIVVGYTEDLKVGDKIKIKVGNLPAMKAEVRWRTPLDSQVLKIGVMYLD